MVSYSVDFNGSVHTYTISDADAARIMTAYQAMLSKRGANGVVTVPNESQVIEAIAKTTVNQLIFAAQRYEQQEAAKAAAATVQPITITPAT